MVTGFLDDYSSALTLLFSFVVAFSTVVYAILTWKLVSETRKMREAKIKPHISIFFEQSESIGSIGVLDMLIQNIGEGPAYDLHFSVNPDFELINSKMSEVGFIKNGLRYLAPNQKIIFFLTTVYGKNKQKIETSFNIEVTYKDVLKKIYTDEFFIDLSQFSGLSQAGTPPLIRIAKSVESIEESIDYLSSELNKHNNQRINQAAE